MYESMAHSEQCRAIAKYEKTKKNFRKAELDLMFLMNCQTLSIVLKFLSFNLPNVGQYKRCIRKCLLRNAVDKTEKKLIPVERSSATYEENITQSCLKECRTDNNKHH